MTFEGDEIAPKTNGKYSNAVECMMACQYNSRQHGEKILNLNFTFVTGSFLLQMSLLAFQAYTNGVHNVGKVRQLKKISIVEHVKS